MNIFMLLLLFKKALIEEEKIDFLLFYLYFKLEKCNFLLSILIVLIQVYNCIFLIY